MILEILVAAAASARPVLEPARAAMERAAGERVVIRYGASGSFARQIESGAPFDLFFAADEELPRLLAREGLLDAASVRLYTEGSLAVVRRPGSALVLPAVVDGRWLQTLSGTGLRALAIASPKIAPYGKAAERALERAGVLEVFRTSLVTGGNVEEALQYVASGNAEIGIVSRSLAESSGLAWAPLAPALAGPVRQFAGVVVGSPRRAAAARALGAVSAPAPKSR